MHVTREEFYEERARVSGLVQDISADFRHRIGRLRQEMERVMSFISDDIGALEGLLNEVESELSAQKQQIDTLTAAANAEPGEHQELVDGHNRLTVLVQNLRDTVSAYTPTAPAVVPPAADTNVADPSAPAAAGDVAAPSSDTGTGAQDPLPSAPTGGEVTTVSADDASASTSEASADASAADTGAAPATDAQATDTSVAAPADGSGTGSADTTTS
jgi:hypothetical protein